MLFHVHAVIILGLGISTAIRLAIIKSYNKSSKNQAYLAGSSQLDLLAPFVTNLV